MSESGQNLALAGEASCAYFGEGVVFKGSITAPEKVIVHGTVEGEVSARELFVGPTGTITGKVSVDEAEIQGKVFERIEAKVCLSLRKTGRIEGFTAYGEIEIEKGGVLSGEVTTIKGSEGSVAVPIARFQTSLPMPHAVSNSNTSSITPSPTDQRTAVESGRLKAAAGQKLQLLEAKPAKE